ncbi:bifunctional (p)ppGpp synthetase/guanosine-3',5'-bis(diphosphate) 3'-pyrophosphohydrolase [Patescibacteria group bacterium]|nr:bifunctional (p)ppGpp synthetase/guanosine-3',5'-bis(diphosphate) 3'-pyrophosphohydrolase [Patescibacteria group bacterium]
MLGDNLLKTTEKYLKPKEVEKIKRALEFATKSHKGQKRATGEDYIVHPLSVALPLAKLHFGAATICSALLHDVVEDSNVSISKIEKLFGKEVATIVTGLTKLKKIRFKDNLEDYSTENLRRMFLAMAQDVRVLIIKLIDRLHNLQTLEGLPKEDQKRIAQETLDIYVPLASRLSMGWIKGALEDLAFPYILPEEYEWTKEIREKAIPEKEEFLSDFEQALKENIEAEKIEPVAIHGRIKGLMSLYKKLARYDRNINRIYDLVAVRLIVSNVSDCYKALGIIHNHYKPLIGRIKDYIATPKANGYQSLHTTLITPQGQIAEVQIRTLKMHYEAEYGVAAYWYYDEAGKPKQGRKAPFEKHTWIKQLAEWQKELSDTKEFKKSLRIDFFTDRIFVFTPEGEVLDLPEGASPIDFAYAIHTDIGHKCIGAKVNERIVTLDSLLENGDVVEITTGPIKKPSHDWLNFVKTNSAKTKIKNWFKKSHKERNVEDGKALLNRRLVRLKGTTIEKIWKAKKERAAKTLNFKDFDSLLISLGQGDLPVDRVIRTLFSEKDILQIRPRKQFLFFSRAETPRAIIEGERGILTNIARCCNPVLGDKIKAYITRQHGASIHKADCPELTKKDEEARILSAHWEGKPTALSIAHIDIHSLDRVGLLKDVSTMFSENKVNITDLSLKAKTKNDIVILSVAFEIKNVSHLFHIIEKVEQIDGVINVVRK